MLQHTRALVALLQTIPAVATKTFVSVASFPINTPADQKVPYLVIHPADGTDTAERLTGPQVSQSPRFTIWSVGLNYDQAAIVAGLVKAKLIIGGLGVVMNVTGEASGPVWYDAPQPIQVDPDPQPPMFWHTAECGWTSDPA